MSTTFTQPSSIAIALLVDVKLAGVEQIENLIKAIQSSPWFHLSQVWCTDAEGQGQLSNVVPEGKLCQGGSESDLSVVLEGSETKAVILIDDSKRNGMFMTRCLKAGKHLLTPERFFKNPAYGDHPIFKTYGELRRGSPTPVWMVTGAIHANDSIHDAGLVASFAPLDTLVSWSIRMQSINRKFSSHQKEDRLPELRSMRELCYALHFLPPSCRPTHIIASRVPDKKEGRLSNVIHAICRKVNGLPAYKEVYEFEEFDQKDHPRVRPNGTIMYSDTSVEDPDAPGHVLFMEVQLVYETGSITLGTNHLGLLYHKTTFGIKSQPHTFTKALGSANLKPSEIFQWLAANKKGEVEEVLRDFASAIAAKEAASGQHFEVDAKYHPKQILWASTVRWALEGRGETRGTEHSLVKELDYKYEFACRPREDSESQEE